jgi:hypothetical protein
VQLLAGGKLPQKAAPIDRTCGTAPPIRTICKKDEKPT